MARKKHREIWPMPIQAIVENPIALTMPNAVFGSLIRLCHHYWITNCLPLPESNAELQVISRAVAPIWNKHREAILKAFSEVQPSLDAYRKKRLSGELFINFASQKARSLGQKARAENVAPAPMAAGLVPRTLPKASGPAPKAQGPTKGLRKDRIPLAA